MDETTENQQLTSEHRELLDQILDKWSLQVLDQLCGHSLRFNELRRVIPLVTQKSLTTTLRRLERNGMIERAIVGTRPIAVEYRISPLGKTIQELIEALLDWSSENLPDIQHARARFDAEHG